MPEVNSPNHRYWQKVNNVRLAKSDISRGFISDAGLARVPGGVIAGVSAPGSADFAGALDTDWTTAPGTVNPAYNGFAIVDGRLQATFAAGTSIDPGNANNTSGLGAPRVERAIADTDFDVYIKIDADPKLANARYSGCGFVLRTATSSARFDAYTEDASRSVKGYIKYGTSTATFTAPIPPGMASGNARGYPAHQRLQRVGNVFTWYLSFDGVIFSQVAQFTWTVTLTHLGVFMYHMTPSPTTTVWQLDYIHYASQTPHVISGTPSNAVVLTERFTNLANFANDSVLGGSASVSGGVLTLTATDPDGSSGRVASLASYAENQGMLFKARRIGSPAAELYFGAVLRGQSYQGQDWAGMYAPPIALIYEGNHSTSAVRLLRTQGPAPATADGANWTYFHEGNYAASSMATWSWYRLEAVGPFFRFKTWLDGTEEPVAWSRTIYDGVVRGSGKIGFALSHNNAQPATGSIEISNLDVYEITANVVPGNYTPA